MIRKRLAIRDQFLAPEGRRKVAQGERSEPWGEGERSEPWRENARNPQAPEGGGGITRNAQGTPLTRVPLAACLPVHRAVTTLVGTLHDATTGATTPTTRHHDRLPRIKRPISDLTVHLARSVRYLLQRI